MKKNKVIPRFIIIIFALALLFNSFSFAVDDEILSTPESSDTESSDSFISDNTSSVQIPEEKVHNSDLYLIDGNEVTIDYTIEGNAYIIAPKVTVKAQINGDLFVLAGEVNIENQGFIDNLFALSDNIKIDGYVTTLYSLANTMTLDANSYIYRDVYAMINNLNIFGIVDRNVNATFDTISFLPSGSETYGKISGDFNYMSSREVNIDNRTVLGKINFIKTTNDSSTEKLITDYIYSLASFVVTALGIYFIISWLAPKFKEASKTLLHSKPFATLGIGFLTLLVIPFIMMVLLLPAVTVSLSLVLLLLYILLLCIASSVFIIAISQIIADKLKFENKFKLLGTIFIVSISLWGIKLIPVVGGIVSFITTLLGLGLVVKAVLLRNKSES